MTLTLFQIKTESERLRTEAQTFKTKTAQLKRYDKARDIERSAGPLMHSLFKSGQKLTLECSINCTSPTGGGWGIKEGAEVEVIDVYHDQIVVACGNTVLYVYLIGYESQGWCKDAIFGFTKYLASKGQTDIIEAEAKHRLESATKSLRGQLKCRNLKWAKESKHFRERLHAMIGWVREAKRDLASAQGGAR